MRVWVRFSLGAGFFTLEVILIKEKLMYDFSTYFPAFRNSRPVLVLLAS